MQISAAVSRSADQFSIETVELDEPRDDEVLVRVVGVGVCHSDIHFSRVFTRPSVLGHEGSGIVERVGKAISRFSVGDRVVMSFNSCGLCMECGAGRPARCENFAGYNSAGTRPDGSHTVRSLSGEPIDASIFAQSSFATYALANERNLVKVPDACPDRLLQILGPLGCGIQTGAGAVLNVLKPAPHDGLVISGAGGVGLSALLAAKALGVEHVTVVDVNAERLAFAREIGASQVVNGKEVNDLTIALKGPKGQRPLFGLDTTGNLNVIKSILHSLPSNGSLGLLAIGTTGKPFKEKNPELFEGGRRVVGILEGDAVPQEFVPEMIKLYMDGLLPFDRLLRTYPFGDVQKAVNDSISGLTIKPVLVF